MNLKDAQIPAAWAVGLVAAGWGAYEILATKAYVVEAQKPVVDAVVELKESSKLNARNSSRSLSLTLSEKLAYYYNELCYNRELSERASVQITTVVIPRWEAEYKELTGRPFVPPECQ